MNAPAPGPLIFWIAALSYGLLEVWVALRDRRAGVRRSTGDPGVRQITIAFASATVAAIAAASFLEPLALHGWAPLAAGVALVVAGIALRLWAIRTLGESFRRIVIVQTDQRLIAEGPYRWVRHPSYTGALLSMAGIGVALGNLASIAICLVIPALGYLGRIPTEEAALEDAFGDCYRLYAARTSRLIPGTCC